jgi:hypothetical protein
MSLSTPPPPSSSSSPLPLPNVNKQARRGISSYETKKSYPTHTHLFSEEEQNNLSYPSPSASHLNPILFVSSSLLHRSQPRNQKRRFERSQIHHHKRNGGKDTVFQVFAIGQQQERKPHTLYPSYFTISTIIEFQ